MGAQPATKPSAAADFTADYSEVEGSKVSIQALHDAQLAFAEHDYRTAIQLLATLKSDPRQDVRVEARANMSIAYLALGRVANALDRARDAVHLDPACVPALLALASAHMANQDWSKAKRRLKQALKVAPHHQVAERQLAVCRAMIERRNSKIFRVVGAVTLVLLFGMLGGMCAVALMAAGEEDSAEVVRQAQQPAQQPAAERRWPNY